MKYKISIAIAALIACLMFVGSVSAAYLPAQTPETQTIATQTAVTCSGFVFESEDAVIATSSVNTPLTAPLSNGEVVSLSAFSQDLVASNGITNYAKTVNVGTANAAETQYNIETATNLEYSGSGAIFKESGLETGASTGNNKVGDMMLCPFEPVGKDSVYPAFCNVVTAKTLMMVDNVNAQTSMGIRSIAATYDVPAVFDYGVTASGNGYIGINFNVNDIEARTAAIVKQQRCSSKITPALPSGFTQYSERTQAIGNWDVTKVMSYTSGL